jgi:hypothetical protein
VTSAALVEKSAYRQLVEAFRQHTPANINLKASLYIACHNLMPEMAGIF